jgi:hypothetical protein
MFCVQGGILGGNGLKEAEILIASHRHQAVNSAADRFWGMAALQCKIAPAAPAAIGPEADIRQPTEF